MDFDLLQVVRTRTNYNRFKPFIKEHTLSKEGLRLFNSIGEFLTSFPSVEEIDWASFETWFLVLKDSTLSKENVSLYRSIFTKLKSTGSSVLTDDLLNHYVTSDYATRIANVAVKLTEGDKTVSMDQIQTLVGEYDKELGRALKLTDLFVGDDISSVLAGVKSPGLEWRLGELAISCGPLRQGDFVIVGARPETGKTTFLADQVSHMATQITDNRPVVWVNNEERSQKVLLRVMQAALGMTVADIEKNEAAAKAAYAKLMNMPNRILITDNNSRMTNTKNITAMLRDTNPALIVFDQLDKVEGFESKKDREDIRLGAVYQWARDLAHEYGPVIAASQASEGAEGQQWIHQNQLRGSKTDKIGEADAIITIGKVHDPLKERVRYIHVPKNKLFGGPRSDERSRHGYWEVTINPEIARYEGTH